MTENLLNFLKETVDLVTVTNYEEGITIKVNYVNTDNEERCVMVRKCENESYKISALG